MAGWCAVTFIFSLTIILISAYPNNLQGVNERFYDELKHILARRIADLKESDNQIAEKPPRPQEVTGWPKVPLKLGQVSGISVNSKNQPVIFHRGNRVWDISSFDKDNNYLQKDDGPIAEDTIMTLDPETGEVISKWGSNIFYMPHGITIDRHDNFWLTDVALHQAFKFSPYSSTPVLEFGETFTPGSSFRHLCKPTSVAVATTGEVFIADGYCNHRVLKFNAAGGLLRIIPNPPEFLSLQVPHGLALLEDEDRICIADRENMRVTCPKAGLRSDRNMGSPALTIQQPDMGRVFDIAARGEFLYAVNGPTSAMIPVMGFTIDPISETVLDHWAPTEPMKNPHTIAVSPNGTALYIGEISPNRIWKFDLISHHNNKLRD